MSGGLHEKHVVATWKLGKHLSIVLPLACRQKHTPSSKVTVLMSPFARNSFLLDDVFVRNSYKAFHDTMTNGSLTDTKSRTHRWAKVVST